MKRYLNVILTLLILCIFVEGAYDPSTYGKPSEFGNLTTPTCWIGGDEGNLSCDGDFYGINYYGSVVEIGILRMDMPLRDRAGMDWIAG